MPLTKREKVINSIWFERTFRSLNDGGIWAGDAGTMRRVGEYFQADLETYVNITQLVTDNWLTQRVILIAKVE